MDKDTQQLFVLEINVNCEISNSDEISVTKILALSGISFAELIAEIIAEALSKKSTSY
jgi:hypothetical protein